MDKYLSNPIIEIISSSAIFGKLKIIDYNMIASIIEFLLNKNIVEKIYTINCPYCCDEVEKIYKKDYEELIECINEGGAWEEYCNGCNQEIDIENINTLKKLTEIDYYKIIAEPINTKYDEI